MSNSANVLETTGKYECVGVLKGEENMVSEIVVFVAHVFFLEEDVDGC